MGASGRTPERARATVDASQSRIPWNTATTFEDLQRAGQRILKQSAWAKAIAGLRPDLARTLLRDGILDEEAATDLAVTVRERVDDLQKFVRQAPDGPEKQAALQELNEYAVASTHFGVFQNSYRKAMERAAFVSARTLGENTSKVLRRLERVRSAQASKEVLQGADAHLERARARLKLERDRISRLPLTERKKAERRLEAATKNLELAEKERSRIKRDLEARQRQQRDAQERHQEEERGRARKEGSYADSLREALAMRARFNREGNREGMRNVEGILPSLRKKSLFEGDLRRLRQERKRLKKLRDSAHGDAYRDYDDLLQRMDERIEEMDKALEEAVEQGDFSSLDTQDYEGEGPFARLRAWRNLRLMRLKEDTETFREHTVRPLRNSKAYRIAKDEVRAGATGAARAWLWRRQAMRYRRQHENAVRAQRVASSSAWKWVYLFRDAIARPTTLSLVMAPLMVPWGIIQFAAWMFFILIVAAGNAVAAVVVQGINLAMFFALSAANIGGSFIQGAADWVARGLLSQIGQCGTPADYAAGSTAPCVYRSLPFDFGIRTLPAPPLVDPRHYFPTQFHTNSVLSVLLDLAGQVPWYMAAIVAGLAALVVPLAVMEGEDWMKRALVGAGILLLAVPAVVGQLFLQTDFYAVAADAFRTGGTRILVEPAFRLAQQAAEAVIADGGGAG